METKGQTALKKKIIGTYVGKVFDLLHDLKETGGNVCLIRGGAGNQGKKKLPGCQQMACSVFLTDGLRTDGVF